MNLRLLFTGLLALAVAAPVIATTTRFNDVPADHQYAEAIRWASDREWFNGDPLFKGKPDGDFDPAEPLTEGQLLKVIRRLFDSSDDWTRADVAALFYYGYPALRGEPPTYTSSVATTTATTPPVVIETTTTRYAPPPPSATTTTAVPRTHHDANLKVALFHDADSNFVIHWVRPGWEAQGWKWRLWSHDPRCGFSNGVGDWNTNRVGYGYANFLLDDGGLCIQSGHLPWQIEIVWDNGQRYVSEACVSTGTHSYTRFTTWNCHTPSGWDDWPNYLDIPTTISLQRVSPYSVSRGVSTFDVTLNVARRAYLIVEFCSLEQVQRWVGPGSINVRLMCNAGQTRRMVVEHRDVVILDEYITVPSTSKSGLSANQVVPQVNVNVTIPEYSPDRFDIDIEVIVGAPAIARGVYVTYYDNTNNGRDIEGNRMYGWRRMVKGSDRFTQRISTARIWKNTTYYIQVHEPDAPTQHLSYTFPEERRIQ